MLLQPWESHKDTQQTQLWMAAAYALIEHCGLPRQIKDKITTVAMHDLKGKTGIILTD